MHSVSVRVQNKDAEVFRHFRCFFGSIKRYATNRSCLLGPRQIGPGPVAKTKWYLIEVDYD